VTLTRRLFLSSALALLAAPFAALAAQERDGFSEAWERYEASLGREWSLILQLNERVKLHNAAVVDAFLAVSLCLCV
jgi:hypothetical protein